MRTKRSSSTAARRLAARCLILAWLAVLLAAAAAAAQSKGGSWPDGAGVGDSVRVTVEGRARVYALVDRQPDRILVRGDSGVTAIPMSAVQRLEVRTRRSQLGQMGRSLFIGGLIGGGTGVLLGLADGDDPASCWIMCMTAGEKALLGGAALGTLGGVTGLLLGAMIPAGWKWEPVEHTAVALDVGGSATGGARIGVRIGF